MKNQPRILFFVLISFLLTISCRLATAEQLANIENTQLVKTGEKFITLLGRQVNVGDKAPDFKVVDGSFSPVQLGDFADKNILISVVPSLDTGICSIQTKRFNQAVEKLQDDTVILTISNDLPFAQRRFCKAEKVENLQVLSDVVWHEFAYNYGVMIKDMGLLTRAVFIINKEQQVVYKELVDDIAEEPAYQAALDALTAIKDKPEPQTAEEQTQEVQTQSSDATSAP